jgi:hypothetical protein
MRFVQLCLVSLLALIPFSSNADWEGKVTVRSTNKKIPSTSGKFFSKGELFRVDTSFPFEMSLYAKAGSKEVIAAVHSFRIRLTSNSGKSAGRVPACFSGDFSACVKTYALKKDREEKCDLKSKTRVCEVYVGAVVKNEVKRLELWHWKGEKEAILSKSILNYTDGSKIETTFSDIQKKSRPTSFFTAPAKYKNAGSLDRFLKDFKGESE